MIYRDAAIRTTALLMSPSPLHLSAWGQQQLYLHAANWSVTAGGKKIEGFLLKQLQKKKKTNKHKYTKYTRNH